jgi:hypothetical protein
MSNNAFEPDALDDELLSELARNTREAVEAKRVHARFAVALPIRAQAGNLSDADRAALIGTTIDISQSGCLAVFERAVQVGDVYRLDLDSRRSGLPQLFARCVRARMVHDTALEAAFNFFVPLEAADLKSAMGRIASVGKAAA